MQDKRSSSSRDSAFTDENFDEEAFSVKLEPDCTEGAYERERQKKENHNKIERRRRFNINDRIRDLGALLPKKNEKYHQLVRNVRQNKGSILKATVDYVKALKQDQQCLKQVEEKFKFLEFQHRRLTKLIQDYESQMMSNGLLKFNSINNCPGHQQVQLLKSNSVDMDQNIDNNSTEAKQEFDEPMQSFSRPDLFNWATITMADPMLSSIPLSSVSSYGASLTSSASSIDLSNDNLSTFMVNDSDDYMNYDVCDNKNERATVFQSKTHKIILQERK